jgi:hypothetical protein
MLIRRKRQVLHLGDAIHEPAHLGAECGLDVLALEVGLFDHIVQ